MSDRCPKCDWEGAYYGFTSVECLNTDCELFSQKLYDEAFMDSLANRIERSWEDQTLDLYPTKDLTKGHRD